MKEKLNLKYITGVGEYLYTLAMMLVRGSFYRRKVPGRSYNAPGMTKKILNKPHNEFGKELSTPIVRESMPPPPPFSTGAAYEKCQKKYEKDIRRWAKMLKAEKDTIDSKLLLLLQHYGLSPNDANSWRTLSLHLATKYVPGFQITTKAKAGRPQIWDSEDLLDLYVAIERKKKEAKAAKRKTTIEYICSHLIKEEPWKSIPKCTEKTLYHRYAASKKDPLIKLLLGLDKREPGSLLGYWNLEHQPFTENSS